MLVLEKAIFKRSPIPASLPDKSMISFSTGTDSPVKAASSTFKELASTKRISAGTTSPASNKTTSPGTKSKLLTVWTCPSRLTLASGEAISFKASIASSAFASWKTPIIAFKITTIKITTASATPSPSATPTNAETAAATKSTAIIKSLN